MMPANLIRSCLELKFYWHSWAINIILIIFFKYKLCHDQLRFYYHYQFLLIREMRENAD